MCEGAEALGLRDSGGAGLARRAHAKLVAASLELGKEEEAHLPKKEPRSRTSQSKVARESVGCESVRVGAGEVAVFGGMRSYALFLAGGE